MQSLQPPALIAAGCSHVATAPEEQDPEQLDEETVETVELDPAIIKLDEAEIGISGPEQIEEAIETLDAQTESRPPLVSGVSGTAAAPAAPGDLFERIRAGFVLDDVEHAAVDREVRWFASHPDYLDRTFKRGERYLYHIVNEIEARKMPLELALLPVVESAFNPVAYSRARASGLWQFIPGTGRRYGLKQNWYYDGRRDVVAATTRRTRLPAVPRRRVRRRLAAGGRCLQLRRSERRARGQAQSRSRQADRLLQPEAAARDARLRAEAARHAPHRRRSDGARPRVRADRESAVFRQGRRRAGRSICTSPPSSRSCARKRCSRSIPRSITGSPIPTARITCWCPST